MKKCGLFLLPTLLFIIFGIQSVSAQVIPTDGTSDNISMTLNPQYPGPNQMVTASIQSYALDLQNSTITWNVAGKVVAQGPGATSATFRVGAIGSNTTVHISIASPDQTLEKNVTISPTAVNLIWQANTYTPPFYKGKALYTQGSIVTLIALPQLGSGTNTKNLIYTWTDNGTVEADASGAGKNTFAIAPSIIPRPINVVVDVLDPISGTSGEATLNLNASSPFVLLYKNDPLYGVEYTQALNSSLSLTDPEVDLTAVPYFYVTNTATDPTLTYNWSINNVAAGANNPDQAFRRASTAAGSSLISLSVNQANALFTPGTASVMINFQNASQNSF